MKYDNIPRFAHDRPDIGVISYCINIIVYTLRGLLSLMLYMGFNVNRF